jgi:hypothetical protein
MGASMIAAFTLLRDATTQESHVVRTRAWYRDGAPPKASCDLMVGDRWVTMASVHHPARILKTDCCSRCKDVLGKKT